MDKIRRVRMAVSLLLAFIVLGAVAGMVVGIQSGDIALFYSGIFVILICIAGALTMILDGK